MNNYMNPVIIKGYSTYKIKENMLRTDYTIKRFNPTYI